MTDRTFGNFLRFISYVLIAGGLTKLLDAYGASMLSTISTSRTFEDLSMYSMVVVALAVVCGIIGKTAAVLKPSDVIAAGLKHHIMNFFGCLLLGLVVCINIQANNRHIEGFIILVGVAAATYATVYYHSFSKHELAQWSNVPKMLYRHENSCYNLAFGCICISSGFIGIGVMVGVLSVSSTVYAAGYMVFLTAYLMLFSDLPKNTMTGNDVGVFLNTTVVGASMTGAAVFVAAYKEAPVRQILILISLFGMIVLITASNLYFRYRKREMPSSNEH